MKIIFAGTPDIALKSFKYFIDSPKYDVLALITQKAKQQNRGNKIVERNITKMAKENNITVFEPDKISKDIEIIEKLKDFTMFHGHCVGLGAIAASEISADRGLISKEEAEDIRRTMEQFGIPASVSGLSREEVIAATKLDKKMEAGVVKFILLKQIGQAFVDRTVTDQEMEAGLESVLEMEEEQRR